MKKLVLGLLIAGVIGCLRDPFDDSPPSVIAETDKTVYGSGEPVQFTILNHGSMPISLDTCQHKIMFLRDRLQEPNWVLWYVHPCNPPSVRGEFPIPPEGSATDTLSIAKPGSYRVRVPILLNNDPGRPDTLITNTFDITVN